ncbi:MAG: hypothetical protein NVS2B12_00830 [Ktedonobacteraceae bacterium]
MNIHLLSFCLAIIGSAGVLILLTLTGVIFWYFRGSFAGSFRWHVRNLYLKQIAALASMFCVAMAASYGLLFEAWGWLYLIAAFKTGTWWLRLVMAQRA